MESFNDLSSYENRKTDFYKLIGKLTETKAEDRSLKPKDYDFQNIDEDVPCKNDQDSINEANSDFSEEWVEFHRENYSTSRIHPKNHQSDVD